MLRAGYAVALFARALAVLQANAASEADENKDLDLIPKEADDPHWAPATAPPAAPLTPNRFPYKSYLEDDFTVGSSPQTTVVPFPSPSPYYQWQNRTSFDAIVQWLPLPHLNLLLSDRFNALEESDFSFPSSRTFRNDLREVYATWEPTAGVYLDAGRINLRNGVALGFNPTDFFKTGSLVGQASQDPSVLRQNRLGTLMVRSQIIWNGGSSVIAFAPKVASPPALSASTDALDPRFAWTNSAYRLLCALNFEVAGLSPQVLGYFEQDQSRIGANLSRAIGDSIVGYAEWTGGLQRDLIARAVEYGKETQTLPAAAPTEPPTDTNRAWQDDLTAGASWSVGGVMLNAEYQLHQGGFSKGDWNKWFNLGSAQHGAAASELWFIRGYANAEQEPVSMHQLFLRADWVDAFIPHLELSGFGIVSLLDASVLGQISAIYAWSDSWSTGAFFSLSAGEPRSEHGSFPQATVGALQLELYL